MACYRPLTAYRRDGQVVFSKKVGPNRAGLLLPCGQCRGCRLDRSREWAIRCVHEAQLHDANCFLTLTYDEEHVPADGSLNKTHWQKFAKRLRKHVGPFRFLHVGEYGGLYHRPHYHALLFGVDFAFDRELYAGGDTPLFVSSTVSKAWRFGFHTIGAVSMQSASYVAKYTLKKVTGKAKAAGRVFFDQAAELPYQVESEYATMSRGGRGKGKGGIGSEWFKKFRSDVFPSDECVVDGKVFRPPRFYDSKLDDAEKELVRAKRMKSLDPSSMTDERLRVREKVAEAREKFFARRI